jgi:hypothetical protein
VSAWAEVEAAVATMPPPAEREARDRQDPSAARFLKVAQLAANEGVLDSPKYSSLAAVQAADARVKVLKRFASPGRPRKATQFYEDREARKVIVAALPAHHKWKILHQRIRHDPLIPNSWAGFLKLLDRLHFSRKETPLSLAYEMNLVLGPRAPRSLSKKELRDACAARSALERRRLRRHLEQRLLAR